MQEKSRLFYPWDKALTRQVDLESWRIWFARALIVLGAVLFPLGSVFSIPQYVADGQFSLIFIDSLVWAVLLFRSFSKTDSYAVNALIILALIYIEVFFSFYILGPSHARPAWLIVCAVMAALLFGVRGAAVTTGLNAVLLMVLYKAVGPENVAWAAEYQASCYKWILFIINASLLTMVSSLPVGYMLSQLDLSLQYERDGQERLSKESKRLKDANKALAREIELRQATEEVLREKEAFQRIVFEKAPDGYYVFDQEGRIVDINQTMEKIQGFGKKEVVGKRFSEIGVVCEDDIPGAIELFKKQIRGESLEPFERVLQRKNGEPVTVELNAYPITVQGRRYLLGVARDITIRKHAEQEKNRMERRLVQAQKLEAIGTLAGGIAHDFNNILSAVIGYTEMARFDKDNPEDLKRHLSAVLKAGMRAKDLVRQILTFSRQESDQTFGPVQVKAVAEDVLKMMRATLPSTIEIRQHLESNASVLANSVQIYQVLMNLCTNAGHAMREQGGEIEVRLMDVMPDADLLKRCPELGRGPHMEIMVRDTGPGIPPEVLSKIFDPYFTTKAPGEGNGLGLSIVHGVVKNSDGAMNVQSGPGQGASFQIYFPVVEAQAATADDQKDVLPEGNEKILLVDDETVVADVSSQLLGRLGYTVDACTSSIEALELFSKNPDKYDLVMTDMTMPGITGKELAKKIMAIRTDIPIILCSGFSHQIDQTKALKMGIKAFAMKPFNLGEIARTVRKALDETSSGGVVSAPVN